MAGVYAILQLAHVVFGLFFGLVVVCAGRGVLMWLLAARPAAAAVDETVGRAAVGK
jgi:hypothetical protein